jgi:hypothetical protein
MNASLDGNVVWTTTITAEFQVWGMIALMLQMVALLQYLQPFLALDFSILCSLRISCLASDNSRAPLLLNHPLQDKAKENNPLVLFYCRPFGIFVSCYAIMHCIGEVFFLSFEPPPIIPF